MNITDHDVRVAEYIIDTSGAVDVITAATRRSNRGRPQNRNAFRLLLIGMFLAISHRRTATLTDVHKVLDTLPLKSRLRLGIYVTNPDAASGITAVVTEDHIKYASKTMKLLAFGKSTVLEGEPDEVAEELARREAAVYAIADGLMDVFDLGFTSTTVAIDATGIWSWTKGVSRRKTADDATSDSDESPDNDDAPVDDPTAELIDSAGQQVPTDEIVLGGTGREDSDCAWGYKTSKFGESENFFGVHEHRMLRVPNRGQDPDEEPRLILRFRVTPANVPLVGPSLDAIDSSPIAITDLIGDRAYHYTKPDDWWDELWDRDINQHYDLRKTDHGFVESDRLRWAAGVAHCPATPDHFGTILRPAPDPKAKKTRKPNRRKRQQARKDGRTRPTATESKPPDIGAGSNPASPMAQFRINAAERLRFALARHSSFESDGTHRVKCPALAGTIGCPLRPGTDAAALEAGLPIVANPPSADDPEGLPKCCTQQTVKVTPPGNTRRYLQPHYWGSQAWEDEYNKRPAIEASFGNSKNSSTEGLRRGLFRFTGLHWIIIVLALVNASTNLRMLRNWHHDTGLGDPNHPLLQQPESVHNLEFTDEELKAFFEFKRATAA